LYRSVSESALSGASRSKVHDDDLLNIAEGIRAEVTLIVLNEGTDMSGGGPGLLLTSVLKMGIDAAMIVMALSAVENIIKLMTLTGKVSR
jgi:hypothetical protein